VTDNGKKVDWYSYSGYRRYHAECHVVGVELVGQRRIRLRIGFLGILSMYGSRADGCRTSSTPTPRAARPST
jgi:hypothetical protein